MAKDKPYLITCPDCGNQYGSVGTHHCKNKPDQSTALLREARVALKPFADCVYNDNGDVTITTDRLREGDYMRARNMLTRLPAPSAQTEDGK